MWIPLWKPVAQDGQSGTYRPSLRRRPVDCLGLGCAGLAQPSSIVAVMRSGPSLLPGLVLACLLVGCSSGDPGTSQTSAPPSPSVAPSPTASPTADPSPSDTALPPPPAEPTAVPPAPATAATPPPMPDHPGGIPQQSGAMEDFNACSDRYVELSSNVVLTDSVSPVVVEGWTEAYQAASAQAAEGDYSGAAASCAEVTAAMAAALG